MKPKHIIYIVILIVLWVWYKRRKLSKDPTAKTEEITGAGYGSGSSSNEGQYVTRPPDILPPILPPVVPPVDTPTKPPILIHEFFTEKEKDISAATVEMKPEVKPIPVNPFKPSPFTTSKLRKIQNAESRFTGSAKRKSPFITI